MSEGRERYGWIYKLTAEQLREELLQRGQGGEGGSTVLRDRLIRFELGIPPEPMASTSAGEGASNLLHLSPPADVRPDSPGQFDEDDVAEMEPVASPHLPRARNSPPRSPKRNDARDMYHTLRRWNSSFSGARGSDSEAFLDRIEEGRTMCPVDDAELFKCLPPFLTGPALYWFRNRRDGWRTWEEFVAAWRARFGKPDFQFALRDEILRRVQGEQEPVAEYLSCMQSFFERLSPPWTVEEQLNYAHRNMQPHLQMALRRDEFRDFVTFETLAIRVEASYESRSRFCNYTPPEKSLFPDLAYRPPKKSSRVTDTLTAGLAASGPTGNTRSGRRARAPVRAAEAPTTAVVPAATAAANPARASAIRCWNCEKSGHVARECTETRRVHCYRCGKKDVTVRTCPTCTGNAEASR